MLIYAASLENMAAASTDDRRGTPVTYPAVRALAKQIAVVFDGIARDLSASPDPAPPPPLFMCLRAHAIASLCWALFSGRGSP